MAKDSLSVVRGDLRRKINYAEPSSFITTVPRANKMGEFILPRLTFLSNVEIPYYLGFVT